MQWLQLTLPQVEIQIMGQSVLCSLQKLSIKIKGPFQLQSAIISAMMNTVPDTVHMHTLGNEYHLKCIPTDSILKL